MPDENTMYAILSIGFVLSLLSLINHAHKEMCLSATVWIDDNLIIQNKLSTATKEDADELYRFILENLNNDKNVISLSKALSCTDVFKEHMRVKYNIT
tara:strand:- start:119145 stop:119438 length:294 start_codon:yes stop_codon:yes gene_type:complete